MARDTRAPRRDMGSEIPYLPAPQRLVLNIVKKCMTDRQPSIFQYENEYMVQGVEGCRVHGQTLTRSIRLQGYAIKGLTRETRSGAEVRCYSSGSSAIQRQRTSVAQTMSVQTEHVNLSVALLHHSSRQGSKWVQKPRSAVKLNSPGFV